MSSKANTRSGKTQRSIQFLKSIGLKSTTKKVKNDEEAENDVKVHKLNKDDLNQLFNFDENEIKFIVERISNKRRIQLMKLLEDAPELDDDFEFILSRKVSVNTEYEKGAQKESNHIEYLADSLSSSLVKKSMSKTSAKPSWIEGNLEVHKKF